MQHNSLPSLQFNTQYAKKLPIRPASDRYTESNLRGTLEMSDGIRPGAYLPNRYLPVMFIDPTLNEGVVIPKGRIVALVDGKVRPSGSIEVSSLIPQVSGQLTIAEDATTAATDFIKVNAEDSIYGYDNLLGALLVPANGGEDASIPYTALDTTAGTIYQDGTRYATASDTFNNVANMPIGITTKDIYQDIRGKYLNYEVWNTFGILADYFIAVPFCDDTVAGSAMSGLLNAEDVTTTSAVYYAVWRQHTFAYLKGGNPLVPGCYVKSDLYGNYVAQYAGLGANINANRTVQTVGKVLFSTSRYPQGGLDRVQTYPGTGAQGTDTAGLESVLYTFASACLAVALGTTPTQTQVLDEVRAGTFGMTFIQLSVS